MIDPGRYFDHAAATTPHEKALAASHEAAKFAYGNPSAKHPVGEAARKELQRCKRRLCELMGFSEGRVVLTSGGSEANNLVINNCLERFPNKQIAIALNAHASMWFPAECFPERVRSLPIFDDGILDASSISALSADSVSLCCINHVCNETGATQAVSDLAEICLRRGVPLLVDGVQASGKIPLKIDSLECDYYTFSAHKFGGPAGVGGIFCRGAACQPMIRGGRQEWGMRAGTENLAGLSGTVVALEQRLNSLPGQTALFQNLSKLLIDTLNSVGVDFLINSRPADFGTGIVSLSFPGWRGTAIASELSLRGYSVATGSACHADRDEPSRVILALGRSPEDAIGTVRISFGRNTTAENVTELAHAMSFLKP